MSRGKKLDIFIGANIEDGWSEVQEKKQPSKKIIKISSKHKLHFKKEKRRGKTVTLVGEFFLEEDEVSRLLKLLKKSLGCGGTFKNGYMEFQGEVKEKLEVELKKLNFF